VAGEGEESSWLDAAALIEIDDLADMLGARHRIIVDDWQAAAMNSVQSHLMDRAADTLEHVDFTPAGLRADLADGQISTGLLYSAAEMISQAADFPYPGVPVRSRFGHSRSLAAGALPKLNVVVSPAPLCPSRTDTSPRSIVKDSPSTLARSP
jgi:hypothetical protein